MPMNDESVAGSAHCPLCFFVFPFLSLLLDFFLGLSMLYLGTYGHGFDPLIGTGVFDG
jgi:hypothetical protein